MKSILSLLNIYKRQITIQSDKCKGLKHEEKFACSAPRLLFAHEGYLLQTQQLPGQALEIMPDKKIVWALRLWTDTINLGRSI